MLKNILLFFTFVSPLLQVTANAARDNTPVDLDKIKFEVASRPSDFQSLMTRFIAGDTTLTLENLATVYYGYAFTPDYDPTVVYRDIENAYDRRDYETTWRLCERELRLNPVSLDLTIKALVAANNINDKHAKSMIGVLRNRYDMLSTIILTSGMGTTTESPFIVICDDDISRIVRNVICVESLIGRASVRNLDAIKIKMPADNREHILYFDNSLERNFKK